MRGSGTSKAGVRQSLIPVHMLILQLTVRPIVFALQCCADSRKGKAQVDF